MKKISLLLFTGMVLGSAVFAQDFKMPAPSPATTINQEFSTSKIEIVYSRPAVKGRKIFGDLVPFGKEWRTGANGATKITFGEEVIFGGKVVPAGTYSIYTIPNKTSWDVILNPETENWGLSGYDKSKNVASVKANVINTKDKVESFTIALDNISKNSCDLILAWENTKVIVPVKADNDQRIQSYLTEALQSEKPPYLVAARYYFEKGKNLDQALAYTEKAIAENPKAFYIQWVKAEILSKMGKKTEAIAAAKLAADGAKGTPYEAEYANNLKNLTK
ncbi:MAG: DUF2911 domain-containing protein [Sphingobacteriales bacterium]|nr:MAG: DUF2911 domain-containing protein [Sphingobacteriales bacterium]